MQNEVSFINILSIKKVSFTDLILVFSLIAVGGFNEWVSAIVSVALLAYLLYKGIEQKNIKFGKSILALTVALISISYFVTAFWAVDAGMAIIGGIKFLPLALFFIAIKQEEQDKNNTFQILILTTAVMVVVSAICSLIPQISQHFTVADRLAGFFQYPNAFAMLVLICELLVLQKEKINAIDIVYLAIFLFGIIYSGSRIVFVLFILSNIAILWLKSNKKFRIIFLLSVVALLLIAFIFFRDNAIIQRFFRISVLESTFVGRILYWYDALPLLLKHPFGMGYLGYNYIHPTIQSGLYTVRFVHNDFLQLFLDIGWIPALALIFVICKKVFSKKNDINTKIILLTFSAHIFFDFDLQFLSMFLILILLLDDEEQKVKTIKASALFGVVVVAVLMINAYMATHLILAHFNLNKQASKLYAWNTENHIAILEKETEISNATEVANKIWSQNDVSFIPYVIKAKAAYANGNFNSVMVYSRRVLELNPFEQRYYEEYAIMLINGIEKYRAANDDKSVEYCKKELVAVDKQLKQNQSKLSSLGKAIKDQPNIEFSEYVSEYIKSLG